MIAVVVDGQNGKEYRIPKKPEIELAVETELRLNDVHEELPFGPPTEDTQSLSVPAATGLLCVDMGCSDGQICLRADSYPP